MLAHHAKPGFDFVVGRGTEEAVGMAQPVDPLGGVPDRAESVVGNLTPADRVETDRIH
jgi:hypothetical protein